MKSIVLEGINQRLKLQETAELMAEKNEVIVRVKAAALNHRDVWIQKGQYAGLKFPIILGSDGAGIVEKIGEGVDEKWLHQEVIVNPGLYWGDNEKTQGKQFKILGLPDDGTFAEFVKVPAEALYVKPAHLSFEEAAALPLAGLTAYRALMSRAQCQKTDRVLVTGIGGGVALFAMQFALAIGAEVFVTSGSDEKIAAAVALGAKGGVNYKQSDWAKQLKTQAGSFDVMIDSAAGEGFNSLVDLAEQGGRIVFYGGTNGTINNIIPQKIFWKQLSVLGSTMGSYSEFEAMLNLVNKHQIKPIVSQIFAFEEAENAMRYMENASQFGKIVIKIN